MADSPDTNATMGTSTQGSAGPPEQQKTLPDATDWGASDSEASRNNEHVPWISNGIITQADKDETYEKTAKVIQKYSDEMIEKWTKQIDNLLVFAGIYSVILTAFNVESYPYLLQPPAPDATLAVLQQIMSLQLNSLTTNPPSTNSTATYITPIAATVETPPVPLWVVTLNILWFWALIIGLGVAYLALMVQQWLHEYQDRCSGASREYTRLRQYRLNNLNEWHVSWIIVSLPMLLQTSLSLFFAGLLVLLWHINSTVAIFASALVGVVMFTVFLLTILPLIWSHCSFLTPPGDALLYALQWTEYAIKAASVWLCYPAVWGANVLSLRDIIITAEQSGPLASLWMEWRNHVAQSEKLIFPTRHHQQLAATHESSSKLDVDMIVDGYHITMSLDHTSTLVPILIDLGPEEVDRCFKLIRNISNRHHSTVEQTRDFSMELRKPFKHGWSSHLEKFGDFNLQQRQTVIFMLSATVMAHGAGTIHALDDLAHIFHHHSKSCQKLKWDTLEHVAIAAVKFNERYLAANVVNGSSPRSLDHAFRLFRSVWVHRKEDRAHKEFFPLALQMGDHLHQSLVKHHDSNAELTKSVLTCLTEMLEFLSHDAHGHKLADALSADIMATVNLIDSQSQIKDSQFHFISLQLKKELDGLKNQLEILGASKNGVKETGIWTKLFSQLCFQDHTFSLCTGGARNSESGLDNSSMQV